jgi:peptidoglycan hydrolase-like protein with peptidoglycan-binding domain
MPPWPLVAINAQGENVKSIQYFLNARGQNLTVDGSFGPLTQAGVKTFQGAHGLGTDGVVGPQTWPVLIVQTQNGSTGDGVRAVQSQIASRPPNSDPGAMAIDGSFGPQTQTSVEQFQTVLGLSVDGIAGPITWSYLVDGYLQGPDAAWTALKMYEAWSHNDSGTAGKDGTPAAVAQLFAQPWSVADGWTFGNEQGAAGTIYFQWNATSGKKLVIAVSNGAGGYYYAIGAQFS